MPKESRAIPKMCGIETEFGIIDLSSRAGPISANAKFIQSIQPEWMPDACMIPWNPQERLSPQIRAELFSDLSKNADAKNHDFFEENSWCSRENILLANGARLYLDGAHVEISTPICSDPKMLITWNRACYRIIDFLRKKHEEVHRKKYAVIRNNVAGKPQDYIPGSGARNSFACHENYTVLRRIPLEKLISHTVPWLVLRTPLIGAGKIGADNCTPEAPYQISQRADFFTCEWGLDTMEDRGIYNTRDAPYADAGRFRRIHVIPGDSNMLEIPEYLKIGLTSILFMMLEDEVLDNRFALMDPVKEFWAISRSLDMTHRVTLRNKKRTRLALDCLWDYYELFGNYLDEYHPENEVLYDVLARLADILKKLFRRDYESLYGVLDWPTKFLFIQNAVSQERGGWKSDLAMGLDYEYHDNDPESVFQREIFAKNGRITHDQDINGAVGAPPLTRSRWIMNVARRFKKNIADSNYWHMISFKNPAKRTVRAELYFQDPTLMWNQGVADQLLALPLEKFLADAERMIPVKVVKFCV
ncbi:MAG: proteasome accessory factor PafA2 family protein [Candidatus Sungbacteria bacterium]|nr:proteasome accessory factor PafA2 family protein [Candidatus Sungbacteria bacterium]